MEELRIVRVMYTVPLLLLGGVSSKGLSLALYHRPTDGQGLVCSLSRDLSYTGWGQCRGGKDW